MNLVYTRLNNNVLHVQRFWNKA